MPVIKPEETVLATYAGDEVMVVGQFVRSETRRDANGQRATSLYLETPGSGSFSVLVEGQVTGQFAALGKEWMIRKGGWIAATGLLVRGGDDFIIQVDQIAQLERIEQQEAYRRLNMRRWSAGRAQVDDATQVTPVPRVDAPRAVVVRVPDATPRPAVRGGHLVFKDFKELGRLFGRKERDEK